MPRSSFLKDTIPLIFRDLWKELRTLNPRANNRPPLPTKEKALLVSLLILVLYLVLALGSTRTWAQLGGLIPLALCLVVTFWPSTQSPAREAGRKLIRFPIFYFGLAFCLFLFIQGLNPVWIHETLDDEGTYQLRRHSDWSWNAEQNTWDEIPHYVTWLPGGIDAPFAQGNAFRSILTFILPWGAILCLWCGITRRHSILLLAWALSMIGFAFCLLVIGQFFTRPSDMLWMFEVEHRNFVGPFIYRNHAAAFLCLLLVVNGALALHYLKDARIRLQRSDPSGWFLMVAGLHWFTIVLTLSRGGFIIGTLIIVLLIGFYLFQVVFLQRKNATNRVAALIITAGGLLVGGYGMTQINFDRMMQRLGQTSGDLDYLRESRAGTIVGTYQMFTDHWFYGVGGYGFRWLFPEYQRQSQEETSRFWWDHAHSDVLEYFTEYGVFGMLWWILMFAYWWYLLIRRKFILQEPLSLFLALGTLILLFGYGSIDFPFRSSAVLTTWALLLAMAVAFPERKHRRRNVEQTSVMTNNPPHSR